MRSDVEGHWSLIPCPSPNFNIFPSTTGQLLYLWKREASALCACSLSILSSVKMKGGIRIQRQAPRENMKTKIKSVIQGWHAFSSWKVFFKKVSLGAVLPLLRLAEKSTLGSEKKRGPVTGTWGWAKIFLLVKKKERKKKARISWWDIQDWIACWLEYNIPSP